MQALDVVELGKRLPSKHRKLRGLIKDTHDIHTAHTDLTLALDFAGRAIALQENPDALPAKVAEDCTLALLSSAIVFYARATKSRSRHRKTFDFRAEFDSEELKSHSLICALRDDAIAHYGPGNLTHCVRLRDDHMLLPGDGQQIVFTSRHLWGSRQLSHIIRAQAQRALLVSQKWFEAKQSEMTAGLNAIAGNPDITAACDAAMVSMADAIGDPVMVADILKGPRVGTRRLSGSTPGDRV